MKTNLNILLLLSFIISSCEDSITIDDRDLFVGTYSIEQLSKSFDQTTFYEVSISKSDEYWSLVWIDNFYNRDLRIYGLVNGDHLLIPTQDVDGYILYGNSFYTEDGFKMNFTISYIEDFYNVEDECRITESD